jgi:hypothetical protein
MPHATRAGDVSNGKSTGPEIRRCIIMVKYFGNQGSYMVPPGW